MDPNSNHQSDLGLPQPAGPVDPVPTAASAAPSSTSQIDQSLAQQYVDPQAHAEQTDNESGESGPIDQEWVAKAKDIVEKTKADPFNEVKELSKIKAGYLKSRYNKDYKVSEDNA